MRLINKHSKLIKVKQEHIEKGTIRNPYSCPVALAIKECGVTDPEVYGRFVRDVSGTFHCPKSVVKFITNFDSRKPVKPFNFILKRDEFYGGGS